MNRRIISAVLASMLFAPAAFAASGNHNDAGCGLGSMLIKDNVAWMQVFAATTNGLFGNQTFGITSGTLGCTSGGIGKTAKAQENFVAINFRDLSREMAAGSGEYVSSLSALMGCPDSAQFGKFAQSRYESFFPAADTAPQAMLQSLRREMSKDSQLSSSCTLL